MAKMENILYFTNVVFGIQVACNCITNSSFLIRSLFNAFPSQIGLTDTKVYIQGLTGALSYQFSDTAGNSSHAQEHHQKLKRNKNGLWFTSACPKLVRIQVLLLTSSAVPSPSRLHTFKDHDVHFASKSIRLYTYLRSIQTKFLTRVRN